MSDTLPSHRLSDGDITLLTEAGELIARGRELKDAPTKLAPVLAEIQAVRFNIGARMAKFKGWARDASRTAYNANRLMKMSPNAAYKEMELEEEVVAMKNSRDLLETAWDTLQNFVNTNQTLLRIASEESKNNL